MDTRVCESSGGTNRVEKLSSEPGNSYPIGNWGEYNGTTWYWEHHCDLPSNTTVRGEINGHNVFPGQLEVSGFPDNWETFKQAKFAIFLNEDMTWQNYQICVGRGHTFIVESIERTPETEGGWTVEWTCRAPARPTLTPWTPPPTPWTPPPTPTATPQPYPLDQYTGIEKAVAAYTLYVQSPKGSGSGFFYPREYFYPNEQHDTHYYIVTNLHVTGDHRWVTVCWAITQTCVDGEVIAKGNEQFDVAVIDHDGFHVNERQAQWLEEARYWMGGWGGGWNKGDVVYASGYPGGNRVRGGQVVSEPVVTESIIASEGLKKFANGAFIEHGANVEPGGSGGPLMNNAGRIVGMNTAGSIEHERLELAIPVSLFINFSEEGSYRIALGSRTVDAGERRVYDLSEAHQAGYPDCHVKVSAERLDIKVDGRKARHHDRWTNSSQVTISNEYSLFASKTVSIDIQCYKN